MSNVVMHEAMDASLLAERLMQDPTLLSALDDSIPNAVVTQVAERLKQEADRQWWIDPQRSLELADLIVAIGQQRGHPGARALGTMARGDALKLLGRSAEGWQALEQAGHLYQSAGDEIGWARTRIGLLFLSTMLSRVPEALADAARAREVFVRHADRERLIRLDWQTAFVHNYLGDARQALVLYGSALAAAESLGEAGQLYLGPLYMNIGSAHNFLGELQPALDFYERARARFGANGETLNLATTESNIALIAQAQGHYRHALQLLHAALARFGAQSHLGAANTKTHILECYFALNRYAEARELALEVVADYRQLGDAYELARALLKLAAAEAEQADFGSAHAALAEAEAIFASLGADNWTAMVWLRRGRLYLRLGEAANAAALAGQASESFEISGNQANFVEAALLKGQAALALDNLPEAAAMGAFALRSAQRYNLPALRYSSHLLLGQAAEARDGPRQARRHYRAAAATTERVQRGLTITLRPAFLEDKGEALRHLIRLHLEDNQAKRALEALEQAKSQVLLSYLTNRDGLRWDQRDAHSRSLIEELERLRAEHQWYFSLAHEPQQAAGSHSPVEPQQAISQLALRERRMRAITEQLYFNTGSDQASSPAPAFSLAQVQQALDDETLLIEYYDDGVRLWAFCLSRQSLTVQPLPAALSDVNKLFARLQMNIGASLNAGAQAAATQSLTGHAQRLLQRLHTSLIAPLALTANRWRRLVIVPYGALHYLPFNLLFDGSQYLIEQHEIVILPAAVLAARPGPRQRPGALIFAHSHDGRLPHTQAEAQMVRRVLGGVIHAEQAATRTALGAAPTQVLHIAAHGQFRLDQPDLSYLQLADGQLYTDDLLQQDLDYELVTLSGCETGRALAAGGELIGLGRGFLYAGAGALILSLWPVADDATLRLMEYLYRALRAGQSKAAALRAAQQTLLAAAPQLHPAFWGAFQLIGDARPLSTAV